MAGQVGGLEIRVWTDICWKCRGGRFLMASFVLGALSLEVHSALRCWSLPQVRHFILVPSLPMGLPWRPKSFSRSVGPMALVLVIKIHLHFLVRHALVGEPALGESLAFGEPSFT